MSTASRRAAGVAVALAGTALAISGCAAHPAAADMTASTGATTASPVTSAATPKTGAVDSMPTATPPTATPPTATPSAATPSTDPGATPGVTSTPGLQLRGPQPLPAAAHVVPTRVRIPAIGVDSTLQKLQTKAGVLQPPTDPLRAGWWAGGPVPGDPGPAVIAGHLDSYTGPAVFIYLSELHAGDLIDVTRSDGSTVVFVVDSVQTYEKSAFPTSAVYGATPGSALRLITCGGTFDRAKQLYLANVVVYASLRT